jgi:hypothetical protein
VEQFNTENVFFRTAGTDYQPRNAGLSLDQMQGHIHYAHTRARKNYDNLQFSGYATVGYDVGTVYTRTPVSDGYNGTPRTGAVTEPRNRLMKLWKRTA